MAQEIKLLLPILLSIIFISILPTKSKAIVAIKDSNQKSELANSQIKNDFFSVNLEKKPSRKLKLREKILLKITKRKIDKQQKCSQHKISKKSKTGGSGKVQIIALILCIFLGLLGVHRFYLGYTGMGILYILTLGLFGIGWLIDIILLLIPNGLTPKGQNNYRN